MSSLSCADVLHTCIAPTQQTTTTHSAIEQHEKSDMTSRMNKRERDAEEIHQATAIKLTQRPGTVNKQ